MAELSEFVGEAFGCTDDAEFFGAAAEWVGDGGKNGAPKGFRVWASEIRLGDRCNTRIVELSPLKRSTTGFV